MRALSRNKNSDILNEEWGTKLEGRAFHLCSNGIQKADTQDDAQANDEFEEDGGEVEGVSKQAKTGQWQAAPKPELQGFPCDSEDVRDVRVCSGMFGTSPHRDGL